VAKGYVALAIDSAASRGFGQTCTASEARRTQLRDRPKDAYAGLLYLQTHAFVDAGRVAVMGWSQGGATVLLSINDKSIGRPQQLTRDFKAAVAFYPGSCSDRFQSKPFTQVEPHGWTSRIPTLVLFGEADVWTRFPPCRDFIEEAQARGNPIELKGYPNAFHSFDAPNVDRRELPQYRLADGTTPIIGTDDLARADALLRAFSFLDREFGR
jgi:dienelactone hydrolase